MFDFTLKKYLLIFTTAVLFLFSAYTLFTSVNSHLKFIEFPYQHEYREGAVLDITRLYLENENPYELKHQPQDTYVYGFFYPFISTPFAKFFGNTLSVHRSVTYAFIILSCILIFFTLISMKVNPVFSFAGAVLLHQSLIYNGLTSIARPEGLGIYLFMLGILIPWRFKFSYRSCLVSIVCGILGYLTKPYYILVIPYIGAYLFFFVSKRKAMIYGCVSVLLLLIMVIVMDLIYETYHNNTFFHHNNMAIYDYGFMKEQVYYYLKVNIVLIIIIILSVVNISIKFANQNQVKSIKKFISKVRTSFSFIKSINIFKDEPVINTNINFLFGFVLLFTMILFVIKFGGHMGNSKGAYLFHLASPFLILIVFELINTGSNKYFLSTAAILIMFTLRYQFKTVNYYFESITAYYKNVEELISKSDNPFNSPETVSIILGQNKKVYNSGHSEYFISGESILSKRFGASSGVAKRNDEFIKEVNEKVRNKNFDLILLTKYFPSDIDPAVLAQNYKCSVTLNGPVGKTDAWYPVK